MQVILKPMTHPELGEIIVKDSLFAIGRHEAPFSGYDAQCVARLSRRHARIFEQDGGVYIADLGSLNGTIVNDRRLDTQPVQLRRGDRICFTNQLCYQIEILGVAGKSSEPAPASSAQLILTPLQKTILEPIVITRFPFLINKASEVFARYRDALPEEVGYISRRHAHIFQKGDELYVEDLGSTNGTFVAGGRLDEHARRLRDGDMIAFGGDQFAYRVQLLHARGDQSTDLETSVQQARAAAGVEEVTRTTFVTSANSFLDIFCVEEEDSAEGRDHKDAAGGLAAGPAAGAVRAGRWQRLREKRRALRQALGGETSGKRGAGALRVLLGALAVVVTVAAWVYISSAPQREIRALQQAGDHEAAVMLANRQLRSHGNDRELSELATESMLKAVVPPWLAAIAAQDFAAAATRIERGRRLGEPNADSGPLLDTLAWVTRLERFIAQRGGQDAPIILFEEEDRIIELVDWWERDSRSHSRALASIGHHVPAFLQLRARVFSHIRSLHNQRSLTVVAIERLLDSIQEALRTGRTGELPALLAEFGDKYPQVEGLEKLRADLDEYALIDADIQAKDWLAARKRVTQAVLRTPVFRDRIQLLSERELPPAEVVQRYEDAGSDWRVGNTGKALASLEALQAERWGEVAERRLRHQRKVLEGYQQLMAAKGRPEYAARLLAYFGELDPDADAWFIGALAEEFRVHRDRALAEAEQELATARQAWERYEQGGGIGGLQRLEAGVSPTYRRLAALLKDAYEGMERGMRIRRLLKTAHATEWDALYEQLQREVKLQRRSLRELAIVLEPALMQAKLDLLPIIQGEVPEKTPSMSSP